jgi:hypothetical protein
LRGRAQPHARLVSSLALDASLVSDASLFPSLALGTPHVNIESGPTLAKVSIAATAT